MTNKDIQDQAELVVRRYFDNYLENVFPAQVEAMISGHNGNRKAHGSAEKKINRLLWGLAGITTLIGILVSLKSLI